MKSKVILTLVPAIQSFLGKKEGFAFYEKEAVLSPVGTDKSTRETESYIFLFKCREKKEISDRIDKHISYLEEKIYHLPKNNVKEKVIPFIGCLREIKNILNDNKFEKMESRICSGEAIYIELPEEMHFIVEQLKKHQEPEGVV